VIDITLGPFRLLENITSWEVSSEPSLSDHRYILFTGQGSVPVRLIRYPRDNNWGSFKEGLRDRLEKGAEMNVKDEARLGLAIHWVQQALISAYEDNYPLRTVKTRVINRRLVAAPVTSAFYSLSHSSRRTLFIIIIIIIIMFVKG
jgi:hypothetical protein